MNRISRFLKDEGGTESVEWAVISALIIIAAASSWSQLGSAVAGLVDDMATLIGRY